MCQADDVMLCHFAFAGKVIAYNLTYYILSIPTNEILWPLERIGMMFLVMSNQIRDALNKDGNGTFNFRDVKNPTK